MSTGRRRVVVTGLGAVTPVGLSARATWQALLANTSGVALITAFDASGHDVRIAAEVKNFAPENHMDKRESRRMDRFAQLAVAAANDAIADSKLDLSKEDTTRIGVLVGTG